MCFARLPKSKTNPGKVVMAFSDNTFAHGLREELTGFQLLKYEFLTRRWPTVTNILVSSLRVRQDRFVLS